MKKSSLVIPSAVTALVALAAAPTFAAPVVYTGAGADPAAITAVRDQFRVDVGGGTVAGANGLFGGLRREINWDGVPDTFAAPNNLPLNFFNVNSPRGAVFSTPGTGVAVSANAGIAPIEFDNINPTYSQSFQTFSAQRLFAAIGSNVVDVNFFVAGTTNTGATSAFASIFTDVDILGATAIEYFDGAVSLGRFVVPVANNGLSFLGVRFNGGEQITRVRITSGNAALGPNDGGNIDVVAMDDFIFAEAQRTVPEPSSLLLLGAAALALCMTRRRAGTSCGSQGHGEPKASISVMRL